MSFNKIKWILGFLLIFLMILATNLIDRKNFRELKDSTVNIYEDRLLTKNVVFNLSMHIQDKAVAIAKGDSGFYQTKNAGVNIEMEGLISSFRESRLTRKETETLDRMEDMLGKLKVVENRYTKEAEAREEVSLVIEEKLYEMRGLLNDLAEIQVTEGKRQKAMAEDAVDKVEFMTMIEVVFLVIITVAVQIFVLYKPRKRREAEED